MPSQAILSSLSSLAKKSEVYQEKLKAISDEIKHVELTLQSWNIGIPASIVLAHTQSLTAEEREVVTEPRIAGWQFLNAYARESLSWERDHQCGKFRLMYSRSIQLDSVATGNGDAPAGAFSTSVYGCSKFPDGVSESKPIIECPIEVRVRACEKAPELIAEIEKVVSRLTEGSEKGGS